MTANLCGCSRPTRNGYVICDECKAELERHLAEMGWLAGELNISLTRVKGVDYDANTGGSAETPLPWNEGASRARENLKSEMVSWVRMIAASADKSPKDSLVSIAAWLLYRLERIAKREDAWVIYDTITGASLEARAFVFAKPAPKHLIGPCEGRIDDEDGEIVESECVGEIFLTEGSNEAECSECLRSYDPDEAIRARDGKLADRLFTLVEIARLAHRTFGQPEARVLNTAKGWQRKGQIVAHGHSDGAERFRYEDVLERLSRVYGEGS